MKNLSDYIKEASNDSKEYVYAVKDEFGSIIQMFDTKEEAVKYMNMYARSGRFSVFRRVFIEETP